MIEYITIALTFYFMGLACGRFLSDIPKDKPILPDQWYELRGVGPVQVQKSDHEDTYYWVSSTLPLRSVPTDAFRAAAKFLPHHAAPVELLALREQTPD